MISELVKRDSVRAKKIPLFAHSFSGFDGHLVLQGLGQLMEKGFNMRKMKLGGLCHNSERLRCLRFDCFRFAVKDKKEDVCVGGGGKKPSFLSFLAGFMQLPRREFGENCAGFKVRRP